MKTFFRKHGAAFSVFTVLSLGLFSNVALAEYHGNAVGGGFVGPGATVVTAAQAQTMRDDTPVTLRGYIIQALGDKHYMFKDSSGTIRVEIKSRAWNGQNIAPQDLVELHGEVDKDWNSVEVEVDNVVKAEAAKK